MFRFILTACLIVAVRPSTAFAEGALTPEVRSELTTVTTQLGELMRQDVEEITIDSGDILEVPLAHTTPGSVVYGHAGALIPFSLEGEGGGNTHQDFVALFVLISPDNQRLRDFGFTSNPHTHVGLLGFTQLDNRAPLIPSWQDAVVEPGMVTVPVTTSNCNGHHGMMTVHVNADWVGPRISLSFDEGATLGPTACLRP